MRAFPPRTWAVAAAGALLATGGACSPYASVDTEGDGSTGRVTVWYHTGQGPEKKTLERQIEQFNAAHDEIEVDLTLLPEEDYNERVRKAAARGVLPDVLDVDGPTLGSYVHRGMLTPLDTGLIGPAVQAGLLASIEAQGTYGRRLYSIGTFDSGLGLYGNRTLLERAGVELPEPGQPAWTDEEFTASLKKLALHDADGQVLDLGLANGVGEWFTYAYSPIVWSAGGDLVHRSDNGYAGGVLNTPAVARALSTVRAWKAYVDPDKDGKSLASGDTALSWNGHWRYSDFSRALGDDLVVLPLPDFGRGTKTGSGSWSWAVTQQSDNKKAAATFLEYLLEDRQVLAMAKANSAIPGTRTALEKSELYGPGKPLELFARQLEETCGDGPVSEGCVAVPRPNTPDYPVVTRAFQKAFRAVYDDGTAPEKALNRAVRTIDTELRDGG
ncbi:sugar ABC transporter substrate-binding protein [Streptomyces sp. NPDC047108]|uniref:ABC transporter substrate-binding protein n=1 Tax=Streptomyces sp. NPDC047108 TaxID=3155025 RepID=UPI0033FAAA5F